MAAGIVWAGEIPEWHEYDAAGNSTGGSFRAESALPQPAGFVGVMRDGQGNRSLAHWDLYGNQGVQIPIDANAVVAPAWHGGALVVSANAGGMNVRRFDANAVEVASTTIAGTFTVLGAGDDKSGLVLTLIGLVPDASAFVARSTTHTRVDSKSET